MEDSTTKDKNRLIIGATGKGPPRLIETRSTIPYKFEINNDADAFKADDVWFKNELNYELKKKVWENPALKVIHSRMILTAANWRIHAMLTERFRFGCLIRSATLLTSEDEARMMGVNAAVNAGLTYTEYTRLRGIKVIEVGF